jgi:hypothetical protein
VVVGAAVVVVVGVGASFGFGGFGGFGGLTLPCFSTFGSPWCACEGGTAGVAGVAGRGFGGLAGVAGMAGVARSGVSVVGFGFGAAGGDEGSGAPAEGGVDGVAPAALPPLGGVGVDGVGAGVSGDGEGDGIGVEGVPPPPPFDGPGTDGLRPPPPPDADEAKIGTKLGKIVGAVGLDFTAAGGRDGETSTGTLRACVLGTASSRMAERSFVVKACIHSWADATAPAATAPT